MFNLYYIKDNKGEKHLYSAKRIYKNVTGTGYTSSYDWVLSAKKIIKVCENNNFPKKYKYDILSRILNHYSMLLYSNDYILRDNKSNLKAVCDLFNSLKKTKNLELIDARECFLHSYLEYITNSFRTGVIDNNFNKIADAWIKKQYNKLIKKQNVDFYELKPKLTKSFAALLYIIKDAGIVSNDSVKNKSKSIKTKKISNFVKNEKTKKRILFK